MTERLAPPKIDAAYLAEFFSPAQMEEIVTQLEQTSICEPDALETVPITPGEVEILVRHGFPAGRYQGLKPVIADGVTWLVVRLPGERWQMIVARTLHT